MTIFQKIAASSFAAVRRTLRRRILMLTLHEAILKDQELDIDGASGSSTKPASSSTTSTSSRARLAWGAARSSASSPTFA
jgi:hypothetical protein